MMTRKAILLVGHDVGAQPAYSYAAVHPTEVRIWNIFSLDLLLLNLKGKYGGFLSYHPRCTRSPSCWKREEYLSWLYSNEAFNPAALNQSDRNEYVSHYSAPGGMHAGFEYYRASPQNASIGARRRIYSNIRRQHHYAYYHIWDKDISSKCTIVPHSGHWIPEEQPKFLVEQLAKFFRE